jgi:hypothetical protein
VDQVALRGNAEPPGAEVGRQRVGVAHGVKCTAARSCP